MNESNVVVLHGHVSSEPRVRELPSGSTLVQLEVTTRTDEGADSVPVALFDRGFDGRAGDEVVVVGRVRRRFFRAGGVTQSRTEVVAAEVVPAGRRRSVRRVIRQVTELLAST